jgi:3alpha(or 20beta)-hydroxysteroid dehydrogenase
MRIDGKVILVSGGARGQGAAHAAALADAGGQVVVGDVLSDEVRAVATAIGAQASGVHLDVTSPDSWDAAVEHATTRFGRLDVLVNNAGIAAFTPIFGGDLAEFDRVIDVNQRGVYLGMRAAAGAMRDGGGGSIVNISSIDGLIGMPGVSAYVASKFAVRGMTKVAALELARYAIRVNSVHPGYIDTPMIREPMGDDLADGLARAVPLRRLGTTADVAELVLFLASDASSYCTGSEFVVDGGVTAGHAPPGMG